MSVYPDITKLVKEDLLGTPVFLDTQGRLQRVRRDRGLRRTRMPLRGQKKKHRPTHVSIHCDMPKQIAGWRSTPYAAAGYMLIFLFFFKKSVQRKE